MEPCKCSKEKEIATIQAEVRTLLRRVDENRESIKGTERIYELIYKQNTNIGLLAEQMKNANKEMDGIKTNIAAVKSKVDAIERRPADNWQHVLKLIVGGVVTFLVGYAMASIFKGGM